MLRKYHTAMTARICTFLCWSIDTSYSRQSNRFLIFARVGGQLTLDVLDRRILEPALIGDKVLSKASSQRLFEDLGDVLVRFRQLLAQLLPEKCDALPAKL